MLILIIFALFFKLKTVEDVQGPNFQALNDQNNMRVETDSKKMMVKRVPKPKSIKPKLNDCSEKKFTKEDLEEIYKIKISDKQDFARYFNFFNLFLDFVTNHPKNVHLFNRCKEEMNELILKTKKKEQFVNMWKWYFSLNLTLTEKEKKIFTTLNQMNVSLFLEKITEKEIAFLTPILNKMQKILSDIEQGVEIDQEYLINWLTKIIKKTAIKIEKKTNFYSRSGNGV